MKKKRIVILLILCMIFTCLMPGKIFAEEKEESSSGINSIISGMNGVQKVNDDASKGRIAQVLNAVIKLIQLVGTGVSVVMLTMLGIKYMLASSSEKAEIKKTAMPMIIGCVLLFAAVNLVSIIASVGNDLN